MKRFSAFLFAISLLIFLTSCNRNDTANNDKISVFETENITRITLYAYYGSGIGSEVPEQHMAEIIKWLDSFDIDRKIETDLVPPGTNTVCVEIEYADGTVINEGLDTVIVDGIPYYTKRDQVPECYWEIMSRTRLF